MRMLAIFAGRYLVEIYFTPASSVQTINDSSGVLNTTNKVSPNDGNCCSNKRIHPFAAINSPDVAVNFLQCCVYIKNIIADKIMPKNGGYFAIKRAEWRSKHDNHSQVLKNK